jgi:hypothetical protein
MGYIRVRISFKDFTKANSAGLYLTNIGKREQYTDLQLMKSTQTSTLL